MAETSFIKTVAFGGYDKAETEKLFEAMNQKICELQNEMLQNEQLLENYRSDSDEVKSYEAVLSKERTKLSQLQAQNETLTAKNKDLSSEMRSKELKIKELKAAVKDLKKKLSSAENPDSDNSAAVSKSFMEAQKASDEMLERARGEAEALRKDAVRLAESIIEEANEKAGRIVSEANKNASAHTQSGSLPNSGLFENFSRLGSQLNTLKVLISDFEKAGMSHITQCENIISDTAENMKKNLAEKAAKSSDDDPVTPVKITAESLSETAQENTAPTETINNDGKENTAPDNTEVASEKTDNDDENSSEDQYSDLEMLMAMAEALNDD